jgi:tripartite-type tricarboxylate transporter receptor subunit TctC
MKTGILKSLVLILGMLLMGSFLVNPAIAKEYPTKTIEILCPYPAGSAVDIMIRLAADVGPKYLGQPMVVVSKPGAAGSTAAADIISSKPDGYRLATMANAYFAVTIKTQKVPFDQNDLIPIANFIEYKLGMFVKGDAPWKTLDDLLDYGRNNPGKVRWAHSGRGLTTHMNGLTIFRQAGVDAIDVPFKGSPASLAALLGGHVDAAAIPYGTAVDQVKAGKTRCVVFFSNKRYGMPADVPCAGELGFPNAGKLTTLFGLYAHKDTPQDIRGILLDACKKIYEDPDFQNGVEKIGEELRFGGPEYLKDTIKEGESIGVPILKELGLYKEN